MDSLTGMFIPSVLNRPFLSRPSFSAELAEKEAMRTGTDGNRPSLQPNLIGPWVPLNPKVQTGLNRFVVVGDFGMRNPAQQGLMQQLYQTFDRTPFATLLALGDNVYPNGEPQHFESTLGRPFSPLIQAGVKVFPVLGNHDVQKGHGDQQLAYWGVPRFYSFNITPMVECFALDTSLLRQDVERLYPQNPQLARLQGSVQLQWLEHQLAHSRAPIKLVYGHDPLYTNEVTGKPQNNALLRQQLEPLFQRYGVDVYLAGDSHYYSASGPIRGTVHLISGGGGAPLDQPSPTSWFPRKTAQARHHFLMFDIAPTGLSYQALDLSGKPIDSGFISRKR